jgi:hypothetical protein
MSYSNQSEYELDQQRRMIRDTLPNLDEPGIRETIAEAQREAARERARQWMDQEEFLGLLGLKDFADLEANLSALVLAGLPYRNDNSTHVWFRHDISQNPPVPFVQAERYFIELWLDSLYPTVERMGYERKKKSRWVR